MTATTRRGGRQQQQQIHTHTHTYIHTYIHACIHMCIFEYIYIYIHRYMCVCEYVHTTNTSTSTGCMKSHGHHRELETAKATNGWQTAWRSASCSCSAAKRDKASGQHGTGAWLGIQAATPGPNLLCAWQPCPAPNLEPGQEYHATVCFEGDAPPPPEQ